MTHIASRGMEEVPCSFSMSFVKSEGHLGRKFDDLDQISAFPDDCFSWSSIQFQGSRSYRPFTKSLGRPQPLYIKSIRCALFSIQSDFIQVLSYIAMSYIVRRCWHENIS